jgi:Fe2+ transport system protein FeoA/Mn-dependent DtxR family transcriptional regulator
LVFAGLWLRTLFRQHGAGSGRGAFSRDLPSASIEWEDALKAAYNLEEQAGPWVGEALAAAMGLPQAAASGVVQALADAGWARQDAEGRWRLSDAGSQRARELVRAHRLWERYLVDREGAPLEMAHAEAHVREHRTTADELDKLDEGLGYPAWDPHGHAIPAPGCDAPALAARPLSDEPAVGQRLRVACLDDESAPLLAQLVAMGIKPGADVEVTGREPDVLCLALDDGRLRLAIPAAHHVFVVPQPALAVPLGELAVGSRARVAEVRGGGKHQRRMLDMGMVPGAEVTVVRQASLGDPVQYRVKGTAVAMRRVDANSILVEEIPHG